MSAESFERYTRLPNASGFGTRPHTKGRNPQITLRRWSATIQLDNLLLASESSVYDLQRDQMIAAKRSAQALVNTGIIVSDYICIQLYKATLSGVREDHRAYGYVASPDAAIIWY